jgi:hypothetical protein
MKAIGVSRNTVGPAPTDTDRTGAHRRVATRSGHRRTTGIGELTQRIARLTGGLLVIISPIRKKPNHSAQVRRRGHSVGRRLVGVVDVSAVDQISILWTAIVASFLLSAT